MRYYDLTLSTQATAGAAYRVVKQWTSHPNGKYDPGAQNIEFDMPITPFTTPSGNSTIIIEGISLSDLQQDRQFTGLNLELKAGMGSGLALSNPLQAGTIATGTVWQSFGNWQGTEMALSLIITPSEIYIDSPGNVILNWRKGTKLSTALKQTFATAYPNNKVVMNISDTLVANQDVIGMYASVSDLAQPVADITGHMGHRVFITYHAGNFLIFDDTYKPAPIEIQFVDLVGQPTWIDVNIMQVKLIMRSDISVGARIKMPKGLQNAPGLVLTTGTSLPSSVKYKSAFQGEFQIVEARQVGNFRTPDGTSWVTILNCAVTNG